MVPDLADRVFVFSEQHRLVAQGPARDILADTDLLLRVNLIQSVFGQLAVAAASATTDSGTSTPTHNTSRTSICPTVQIRWQNPPLCWWTR